MCIINLNLPFVNVQIHVEFCLRMKIKNISSKVVCGLRARLMSAIAKLIADPSQLSMKQKQITRSEKNRRCACLGCRFCCYC